MSEPDIGADTAARGERVNRPCHWIAKGKWEEGSANGKGVTKMSTERAASVESASSDYRIVVGIDGSENSMKALDWAAGKADRSGAVLEIQTAYEPAYEFITHDEVQMSMDRRVKEAEARVAMLVPQVTTKSGTHIESPATMLIEASEGAELLVVGSRGLGGFKGLLLGSVSQKCSLHARCPIAIIR